jgi:Right handed beta helix region
MLLFLAAQGILGGFRDNPVGDPLPGLAPGMTVTLAAGEQGPFAIQNQRFDPPVTIDATAATVRGLRIWNSSGIIVRGGTFVAADGLAGKSFNGYAVDIRASSRLRFEGVTFTRGLRGLVAADSRGITVRRGNFTGLRSDGINLPGSSDVLIERSRFTDFVPTKPSGDKAAGTWKDGDHPDAIQIWTTKANPRMTDIVIRDNIIEGDTQGINTFGPRGLGYARIRVTGNRLKVNYPAAISLIGCEDCTVTGNTAEKLPTARFKANVRLDESSGLFCGNTLADVPRHLAAIPCAKP